MPFRPFALFSKFALFVGGVAFIMAMGSLAEPSVAMDGPVHAPAESRALTDDWTQWRGPGWTNVSGETVIPLEFGAEQNLAWRVELPGPGGSSPIVWNNQAFVTSVDGDQLCLVCVDAKGTIKWKERLEGANQNLRMDRGNYASPSPMTDGKMVWATTGAGVLHCFDLTGKPQWKVDLQQQFGEFEIQFGMSTTPILDNGRIYLQLIHGDMRNADPSRAWVVALDALTGKEVWKANRDTEATHENKHSYSSPVIYRDGKLEFLITHGGDYVVGHSLADGSELWRVGGLNDQDNYNRYLRFVSSPTCVPGLIVVPSAKSGPVLGLDPANLAGDSTNHQEALRWRLDRGTPDVASPLIDQANGVVYLCRENGILSVLDSKTGSEISSERRFADKHRSTPVLVGKYLVVTGRDGDVVVFEAGREPKVVWTAKLGEEITASPAISNGRIYVRTYQALYAFGPK